MTVTEVVALAYVFIETMPRKESAKGENGEDKECTDI